MIRIARKIAKRASHKYAFHSVVVLRGGAIVAQGYNHGTIHAEEMAVSSLWPSERRGCKLWSIRVTKGGKLAMAKPCKKCQVLLRENGIKHVWFSNNDGEIERMKLDSV